MRRKNLVLLMLVFSLLLGLCGCGVKEDDGVTLWVLTEESTSDGMNLQAEIIAERMEEKYDNLTVQLDILPTDAKDREVLLKQLRTQIMAGKGPDVYLLPTGNQLMVDISNPGYANRGRMYTSVEPLFWDVSQIMRNQLFADISAYYDRDSDLGKEALKPEIMDAGVYDGKRFVLPLRFTMPILMSAPEDWEQNGMSAELLNSNAVSLVDTAVHRGDTAMLTGLQLPEDSSLLPRLFDYEAGEVLVSAEEIADYMRAYQAWKAVFVNSSYALLKEYDEKDFAAKREYWKDNIPEGYRDQHPFDYDFGRFNTIFSYICDDMTWHAAGLPLFTCSLADSLETLAISKQAQFEAAIYPLRASDGSVIASISYYGAVGCGCKQPELAYEFLRQFLTEEFQWDIYRPRNEKKGSPLNWPLEVQTRGQVEGSWPVRADGAFPYMWSNLKYQMRGVWYSFRNASNIVSREIQNVSLTDADLPALSWPIDEVRFPVFLKEEESIEYALSLLNEEDGTPTGTDIDALAEQVYQNLRYHLAEG